MIPTESFVIVKIGSKTISPFMRGFFVPKISNMLKLVVHEAQVITQLIIHVSTVFFFGRAGFGCFAKLHNYRSTSWSWNRHRYWLYFYFCRFRCRFLFRLNHQDSCRPWRRSSSSSYALWCLYHHHLCRYPGQDQGRSRGHYLRRLRPYLYHPLRLPLESHWY